MLAGRRGQDRRGVAGLEAAPPARARPGYGCATPAPYATSPTVESAWGAGEIDRTHLATMLSKRTPRTAVAFGRDHKVLLDAARTQGFVEFKRRCDRWEITVDPDGAEQGADCRPPGP